MNKKGITLTVLAITIAIMIILLTVGGSVAIDLIRKGNVQSLVSDMLLVQTKVKIIIEQAAFKGDTSIYIGTKLKDEQNKQIIANGVLTSQELEQDSIYIYDRQTLDSIGLNKIDLQAGEVFLVDYNNSDIIFPKGCKKEDGTMFYRLSEMQNNLVTYADSYIQVVSFQVGKDYIDAEAFVSDIKNEVTAYQFLIGTTEAEVKAATGTWQTASTYHFSELNAGTTYYVIAKIKNEDGSEKQSNVYTVKTGN